MTSRDFCFWLQGHFEISDAKSLGKRETDMIRRHLAMVFKHEIDPSMPDPTGELQQIHLHGNPPSLPGMPLDGNPPVTPETQYRC